ncbi:MAG: serine/threonine protein kinase [Alphaproteobacteria bacterium]|nr:serine/threonine protein kinase [Alphaproteobacteria bacterium]MBU0863855.1 serine/threonine protein kinase [Alphaproteobacteria bacterium]MBU1826775.1 serine/threonine protein kinase [Alphaproteobacteria bacterium]
MAIDLSALPTAIAKTVKDLEKKYEFETLNLKGGNGYALVGRNRLLNRKVVVKFYYWGGGAHAEPKNLSSLASPHVLRVEDAASIDQDYAYFVTPFCERGDLDDLLEHEKIGIVQAVDYLQQIASGVSFIHGAGYIHRDLKPSNIFCDANSKLVIGDFGSVVKIGDQGYTETNSTHSIIYRTPEEIFTSRAYTQGDVYQLGIILYQLLGGRLSYDLLDWLSSKQRAECDLLDHPDNELYADGVVKNLIQKGRVVDLNSLPAWCPRSLVSIIRTCTKIDRANRFESVSALKAKLSNVRGSLPDWRLEPGPVLYRNKNKLRLIKVGSLYHVEKMAKNSESWRRVHSVQPAPITDIVALAERL